MNLNDTVELPEPFKHILFFDAISAEETNSALAEMPPRREFDVFKYPEESQVDGKWTRYKIEFGTKPLGPTLTSIGEYLTGAGADTIHGRLVGGPVDREKHSVRLDLLLDLPGYQIAPHPDTAFKTITSQFYLTDKIIEGAETRFYHEDGSQFSRARFAPGHGYAFLRAENSLHGVEPWEHGVRYSLLLRIEGKRR